MPRQRPRRRRSRRWARGRGSAGGGRTWRHKSRRPCWEAANLRLFCPRRNSILSGGSSRDSCASPTPRRPPCLRVSRRTRGSMLILSQSSTACRIPRGKGSVARPTCTSPRRAWAMEEAVSVAVTAGHAEQGQSCTLHLVRVAPHPWLRLEPHLAGAATAAAAAAAGVELHSDKRAPPPVPPPPPVSPPPRRSSSARSLRSSCHWPWAPLRRRGKAPPRYPWHAPPWRSA
mmetsp:Transcript_134906/g.349591  ORF Transcript_134906/g.349591 Transcript_134906/m.349591 type:complete len:230 (-) Transcript_134906:1089-1778(-)